MIEWRDEGVLLSCRKHGETAAICEVFTESRGRWSGVVRGGVGRKLAPILQPGAQLDVCWKARLEDHLGAFTVEPIRSRSAAVMASPLALAGLSSTLGLLGYTLPEREPAIALYETSITLLDLICATEAWPLAYLRWEIYLLEELGFGLDLNRCAVSGATQNLAYVSPKSGRAVARSHAGEWADRLLPFPKCMVGDGPSDNNAIAEGLKTTGYFLEKWVASAKGDRPLPEARARLLDRLSRP